MAVRMISTGRKRNGSSGFTLVELLIAMGLSGIAACMVTYLFISQQRSYRIQIRLSALQQNLRTAMNILSRDIRMAGYGISMDHETYDEYIDWDPRSTGAESFAPRIQGINDITGMAQYRNHTDVVMIVKAGADGGILEGVECALADQNVLFINALDLDDDGDEDFSMGGRQYGVLMKSDMTGAQLFKIMEIGPPVTVVDSFRDTYIKGDRVSRADIVVYRVDDRNPSFPHSVLERNNIGKGDRFQVVAENITDLQLRYILKDGTIVEEAMDDAFDVSAVEVSLAGEVDVGRGEKRRRTLTTLLKIRNG